MHKLVINQFATQIPSELEASRNISDIADASSFEEVDWTEVEDVHLVDITLLSSHHTSSALEMYV